MTTFTKDDLLYFNEMMLGRGVPVEDDGIGYNKADYGACATYFYGLSNAQLADLAKRLVKYTETQLHVSKDAMKETAKKLAEQCNGEDRSDGISIDVREDGTLISFRYNEKFIETIKSLPISKRKWDGESKNWIVNNDVVIPLLNKLWTVGADVKNSLAYASNHEIIINLRRDIQKKIEILTKIKDNQALLKFDYNQNIVDAIKQIDRKERQWNADYKFWAIGENHLKPLQEKLSDIAVFKQVK